MNPLQESWNNTCWIIKSFTFSWIQQTHLGWKRPSTFGKHGSLKDICFSASGYLIPAKEHGKFDHKMIQNWIHWRKNGNHSSVASAIALCVVPFLANRKLFVSPDSKNQVSYCQHQSVNVIPSIKCLCDTPGTQTKRTIASWEYRKTHEPP